MRVERDTLREQRWQSRPSEDRPAIRPLLLTLLGEFVFPGRGPVWVRTFVEALDALGYSEGAARQELARSAAAGWLVQERVGRHSRLALSEEMERLLRQGSRRIYGFGLAERAWNGEWLLLQVSVPESRRELRHRLHTRLTWAGFGPLGQGMWVSPDPTRETDDLGVSSSEIADRITGVPVEVVDGPEQAAGLVNAAAAPGDVVLVLGAGDIWKASDVLFASREQEEDA